MEKMNFSNINSEFRNMCVKSTMGLKKMIDQFEYEIVTQKIKETINGKIQERVKE